MGEMDDQEEKEILMQHSEKLAFAYDFLKVVPKKPTRIIKAYEYVRIVIWLSN